MFAISVIRFLTNTIVSYIKPGAVWYSSGEMLIVIWVKWVNACVCAGSIWGRLLSCVAVFAASHLRLLSLSVFPLLSDGKYHEQVKIAEDATGYSYEVLFKPYISSLLTEVWVEDPYIRQIYQVRALFPWTFCCVGLSSLFWAGFSFFRFVQVLLLITRQSSSRHYFSR